MKKVLKCILGIIGICYFAVVIVVTACLLCYNQYKVTEMFGYTFVMIDDNSDMYNNGDLVLFQENELNDIRRNDTIFFYEVTNGVASIRYGTVTEIMPVTNEEKTFSIEPGYYQSIRMIQTGTDSNGQHYLTLSGIEFLGRIDIMPFTCFSSGMKQYFVNLYLLVIIN